MSNVEVERSIEAILMVVDEPVTEIVLAQVLERPVEEIEAALLVLEGSYEERGFSLRKINGGWRFYSHPSYSTVVEKFVLDGQQSRLTQAALETLSVIAYRQPVSRARVSAIRGVNVEAVMKTLIARGLVEESGLEHETGAILYKTTSYFLERLGLNSLEDLPALAPYLPDLDGLDEILDIAGLAACVPVTPAVENAPCALGLCHQPQEPQAFARRDCIVCRVRENCKIEHRAGVFCPDRGIHGRNAGKGRDRILVVHGNQNDSAPLDLRAGGGSQDGSGRQAQQSLRRAPGQPEGRHQDEPAAQHVDRVQPVCQSELQEQQKPGDCSGDADGKGRDPGPPHRPAVRRGMGAGGHRLAPAGPRAAGQWRPGEQPCQQAHRGGPFKPLFGHDQRGVRQAPHPTHHCIDVARCEVRVRHHATTH